MTSSAAPGQSSSADLQMAAGALGESDSSDIIMVKSKVNVHHYGQEVRDGFSKE